MKKIYVLFTMLLALGFGNLMAQGQGLCTYSQDSVKQTILNLPQQDGKCIYLLVLEDTGGDGWDGASIDVSIAEGDPTNYKVTAQDTSCLTIPIYIEEGQTIDLTYWNGANELEHSFYLYNSNGDLAVDNEGTTMAVGPNIPANDQFRVKATCPFSNCNGELIETDMFVQGLLCPDEPVFWQILDSNGDIVYDAGPTIDINELQQDSIFLEKCEEYTLVFGSSIGTDWASLSWRLRTMDPNYGDLLFQGIRAIAGDSPAPADFIGGMLMQNITIPCEPKADDLIVIEGGDPATCTYVGIDIDNDNMLDSVVNFPLVEPVSCYPQLGHVLCASPAVTVDVYLPFDPTNNFDNVYLGSYNYDHLGVYTDATNPADGIVVDTDGDGIVDAVQMDYSEATQGFSSLPFFPEGIEAGSYDVCYQMTYNCQDFNDPVTVMNCTKFQVTTTSNPVLACNDLVNISLNYSGRALPYFQFCQQQVTADDVLEDFTGCAGDYIINIFGAPTNFSGDPVNGESDYIVADMAGGVYDYTVTHIASGNKCWGQLRVEDKEAPLLSCNSYDAPCNHPDALTLGGFAGNQGYSTIEDFCVGEQAIKFGETSNANLMQISGGNQIPIELGCAPLGEIVKQVQLVITIEHTKAADVKIHLTPPGGSQIRVNRTLESGVESVIRINLLPGQSYDSLNEAWILHLTDIDDENEDECTMIGTPDASYGKLIKACLRITHGYPDPYIVTDCNNAGNPVLLNENIIETNCDQSEWYGMTVERTWQAADDFGNTSTCIQTINLVAPTYSDIVKPADSEFECGALTNEADPDPIESGIPTYGCFDLVDTLHHGLCDISFTYEDATLATCGNGKKIIRTWTFVAWCSGVTHTYEQIIKIEDTTGPTIDVDAIVLESTEAYDCNADVDLMSAVSDACSGVASVTATYVAGGGSYNPTGTLVFVNVMAGDQLENLPIGATEVNIIARDSCLNETTQIVTIEVSDQIAPIAICDDNLHVSLGADGTARIYAADFDEGSYDNCGDVTLKINNNSFFAQRDYYEVDCGDIGTVTLYLFVEDENGNETTCWAEVLVEDALTPVITGPADITITCDDPAVHAPFGEATAIDNCTVDIDFVDGGELDQCKAGTLTRTWTATDGSDKSADVSATQRVTVTHVSDFVVQFPADVTLTNCELQDAGEPSISDDDCELLAISSEDLVLNIVDDACFKIERTWTIVNWCVYEEGNASNTDLGIPQPLPRTYRDDDGYFTYVQTIKVLDSGAPVITNPGDQSFCDLTEGCEGNADLTIEATDACSPDEALEYTYKIDAFNDGTFDIVAQGNDASGVYPYGTHLIKWIVEDGCGNTAAESYLFTVADCKNPTPVCLNGVSIENMQTGCVDIWASDLLEYAFDNCTDAATVEGSVRMRREGDITSPTSSLTLCCEDVGTVIVEIWVEDEAGNADYCTTYIVVQDNLGNCDGGAASDESRMIAGTVRNEAGDNVENVTVDVDGAMSDDQVTGTNGGFMFNAPANGTYTVTPTKDMNPLNGVSTYDLVLISQHILGQGQLDSPYKMIAADINNDGNISTFDVVQLRQLILFIVTDFTDNASWRFVDAAYTFPNTTNPWMETFPESMDIASLTADMMANDFVGVKIGDVNGDAAANTLLGTEDRNKVGTLNFEINDTKMTAGQTYTVDFLASDFANVNGFQFTVNFDATAMNFASVEAGAINVKEGNFGYSFLNEGVLTASWNTSEAATVANDDVLFSMTFNANDNVNVSDVLAVNSRYTNAEAYTGTDLLDVALTFNGVETAANGFELLQNTPNPFSAETVIGFNLPTAADATLRIYDVSGRTLTVVEGAFERGYNQVVVDGNSLDAAGVLYYELSTADYSATKKMILLDK